MADPSAETRRRMLPPSPAPSSSRSTTESDAAAASSVASAGEVGRANVAAFLERLPSSPRDLLRRLERQKAEIDVLRANNHRLQTREVEVSALAVQLQQQIGATQSQVDRLKHNIQEELTHPITEADYQRIDATPESGRDLVDAVKIGIFRQIGTLRASQQAAVKRAAEMSAELAKLNDEHKEMQLRLAESEAVRASEKEAHQRRLHQGATQDAKIVELESVIRDLQARYKGSMVEQENYLQAKMTAQLKTEEVARLAVRLEETEMDAERHRANAECCEQKLDILKAEYYEVKLKHGQRILELESCLRAADEKIKCLGDLEMESELFISNLAEHMPADGAERDFVAATTSRRADGASYESYLALPRSRKLAHTLIVTKRCLHLENQVSSLQHDVEFKDKQIQRLQVSLEAARDALNSINSPYALVEKTVMELTDTNERLHEKVKLMEEDNQQLRDRLAQRNADVEVLTRHRKELLHMKKLLGRLGADVLGGGGASAGRFAEEASEVCADEAHDVVRRRSDPNTNPLRSSRTQFSSPNSANAAGLLSSSVEDRGLVSTRSFSAAAPISILS